MKHYLETDTDRVGELAVRYFPKKGRGIVAMRDFRMGEFVAEYTGILLTKKQAKEKEEVYGEEEGSFMYYFKYNGQIKWWVNLQVTEKCISGQQELLKQTVSSFLVLQQENTIF